MAGRGHQSAGGFKKRAAATDDEMDITPMIDCVFLLLIFFMVTSTMQGSKSITLPTAKHGAGVSSEDSAIVSVFNDDGAPGLYLSDSERNNGPVELTAVGPYVKESGKRILIIKADRDVPSGFIEEVARAAADEVEDMTFYVGITDKKGR